MSDIKKVTVDCLGLGVSVVIELTDGTHYSIMANRRFIGVNKQGSRLDNHTRQKVMLPSPEEIVSSEMIANPLELTDNEVQFFETMFFHLSNFEKASLRLASQVAVMWSNEASDRYIYDYVMDFLKEYFE